MAAGGSRGPLTPIEGHLQGTRCQGGSKQDLGPLTELLLSSCLMETVGRNEACPCGSGRKFKRCCGAKQPSPVQGEAHREQTLTRVMDWLDTPSGRPVLAQALDNHVGPALSRLRGNVQPEPEIVDLFAIDHAMADWRDKSDQSLVDCMRRENVKLDLHDVTYLTGLSKSARSLHLVQRNDASTLILNDLWRDHQIVVEQRIGERGLAPGTLLIARILKNAGQQPRLEGPTTSLGADRARELLGELSRAHADAPVTQSEEEFLKSGGARRLLFHELADAAGKAAKVDALGEAILRLPGA